MEEHDAKDIQARYSRFEIPCNVSNAIVLADSNSDGLLASRCFAHHTDLSNLMDVDPSNSSTLPCRS